MSETTHPEILWAQRSSDVDPVKNVVFLTINLPDIQESTLECDLTPTNISFKARSGNPEKGIAEKNYAFDLELFDEIIPEESVKRLTTRSFYLVLRKKEKKIEYWPRLTKVKAKTTFVKTDFDKWVDEDEQNGGGGAKGFDDDYPGMPGDMDFDNMMSSMGAGAGPGPGPSGVPSDSDSDDDNDDAPPPLEDADSTKE